jgi:hypothetical protein
MPLSWNEIKDRSIRFSKEWETETSENAEAKTFWDDCLLNVYICCSGNIYCFASMS